MCSIFPRCDKQLANIFFLGLCFMVLFAADYTISNMQKTIVSSITDEKPEFKVDGYTLYSIIYIIFSISLWLGPSLLSIIGPKLTMIFSAIGYTMYVGSFLAETKWVVYLGSVVVGLSAGALWTAEGNYLVLNSTPSTTARNVGIFWLLYSMSQFIGNTFVFIKFHGKVYLNYETRQTVIQVLTGISSASVVAFLFLPSVEHSKKDEKNVVLEEKYKKRGPLESLKKTWLIFTANDMLILAFTFCYTGLQQAFQSGIYSPSIGFTLGFGNISKQLVALSGIAMGSGELLGGTMQIVLSGAMSKVKFARSAVVTVGCLAQVVAYILAFINLPNSAVFGNTFDSSIIENNAIIAMLGSFLLGFGDSCLNTQNFSIIADMFPNDSAQTAALYKFTKSLFGALTYFLSTQLGLHAQVMILVPSAIVSTLAYCIVDARTIKKNSADDKPVVRYSGHQNDSNKLTTNNRDSV